MVIDPVIKSAQYVCEGMLGNTSLDAASTLIAEADMLDSGFLRVLYWHLAITAPVL